MARLHSIVALLGFVTLVVAAKKADDAPAGNPVVDYVAGLVGPVKDAVLGTATDAAGLLTGVPAFGVSVFVWLTGKAREMPDLVKDVYNADASTLDNLTSFAAETASIIFVVYTSLTALNLLLGLMVGVKDYFVGYLTLPTSLPVLGKMTGPILEVRNLIQSNLLDRIKNAKVGAWIVPLEGQSGKPSLKGAVPVLASATAACMLLSCAPAIHGLIKSGADKAKAEALLYTLGLGLGVQYVVGRI